MGWHGLPSRGLRGALLCAALVLVVAAPAGAFLRDVDLQQPPGVLLNGASLPITCFNGRLLIGMGADTHPAVASGGVGINRMWPADGRADQAVFSSVNTDGGRARWGLSGQVHCAGYTDTAPTAATGGPYLKDPVLVRQASVLGSSAIRIVDANCGGRRPIGGGFSLVSTRRGAPPAHVTIDRAEVTGRIFRVVAHETEVIGARWSLEAYAICANYTDPIPGQVYVGPGPLLYTQTSPPTSSDMNIAGECPPNWYAIGGGAQVTGTSTSKSGPPQVVLTRLEPVARFGSARPSSWIAAAREEHATSASWRLQVKTICVPLVSPSG